MPAEEDFGHPTKTLHRIWQIHGLGDPPHVDSIVLESGLPELLGSLGARIILTAGEVDREKIAERGWFLLVRPFTDTMLRRTLAAKPPAL